MSSLLRLPPTLILPVELILLAVKLPVYVGKNAATLAFEYVAGNPVNCEPLPR